MRDICGAVLTDFSFIKEGKYMQNVEKLAIHGGSRGCKTPLPHEVWPPEPSLDELSELVEQRKHDISIKGRSGIIQQFEDEFLRFLGDRRKFAVTFNSGTSALQAAYLAIGIQAGDEIIGPALTFHAALTPSFLLGAEIRLVDVDINTRCVDPTKIEQAITSRTKAIAVVHQWGHPADMHPILEIAARHNLKVIEDCSHAHGSTYKGEPVGTFGDIAVFSLQAAKMIYAGEGGILVTNDRTFHDRAVLLGHYRDRSRDEITEPLLQRFWVTGYGQKYRMSPLNAVVARHALREFSYRRDERHRCLNYFKQRIDEEIPYLETQRIEPWANMGAWYGFKPLYKPERLNGLPLRDFLDIVTAEGLEISKASAPVLASEPLFTESRNPLTGAVRQVSNERSIFENANLLEQQQLSMPTFSDWKTCRPLIDEYISVLKKVWEWGNSVSLHGRPANQRVKASVEGGVRA